MAAHHVQDDQRAVEVIIVVFDGLGHALAHRLVSGKLDDGGDVRALGEDLLHVLVLGHVRIVEAEVLAGDLLHAVQNHGGSVIEIVCHDHVIAGIQKFDAGVAADIAGTAGNQNCHSPVPLSLITCSAAAGRAPACLKNTTFSAQNQGTRFLFTCNFVASSILQFLISKHFLSVANGWMALFVQMGERKRTAVRFRQPSVLSRYSLPHCLPVKKRRVVVARNTLPARSTVEGNSGWEGLQG